MDLPVMPPLAPMLAKSVAKIPPGMQYEAKWDGFRTVVFRDGDEVELGSRTGKPLTRYFPEVVEALKRALPPRCVLDGEVVIARDGRLRFEELLERIHPAASRVTMLAARTPASFVAFDLLALGDASLLDEPLSVRRPALEAALADAADPVFTAPASTDRDLAQSWFAEYEGAGLDGVVAKPLDQPYRPGERTMFKIKHERTADCVVAGYREHKSGPVVGSCCSASTTPRAGSSTSASAPPSRWPAGANSPRNWPRCGWTTPPPTRGAAGPTRPHTPTPGCPARSAAGPAARISPGWRCAPSGWSRWRTTTWRGRASGTPHSSAAGAGPHPGELHLRAAGGAGLLRPIPGARDLTHRQNRWHEAGPAARPVAGPPHRPAARGLKPPQAQAAAGSSAGSGAAGAVEPLSGAAGKE